MSSFSPTASRSGPLADALWLIGLGAVCVAGTQIALILHQGGQYAWLTAGFPLLGLLYVIPGLVAWARRPGSRLGLLLVVAGAFALLPEVAVVDAPVPVAVAWIVGTVILGVIVQLLLSFPTGRLHTTKERVVVLAGYFVCLPLQAPMYLFDPDSPLLVADRPDLLAAGRDVQRIAGALVVLATAALLIERMRRARPEQRRVLVPLSVYGIFALLVVPVSSALEHSVFDGDPVLRTILQLVSIGLVPIVLVVAASRGGFERTSDLAELGVWLGRSEAERPELRAALATSLGDPSVQVLFRVQGEEALVDERGIPAVVAEGANGRGTVDVELGGRAVGAIVYDAMLVDRPEEIRKAGRIVAIALDRQRLNVELRASRARIAATADGERRRIARDLHDGLQARLVLLAVQAAGRGDQATLQAGIQSAIEELRELVNGVMPAQLTERGLAAAVEDLRDRLPLPIELRVAGLERRLRLDVESAAYFVLSEAISNALKHAGPAALTVSLERAHDQLVLAVADDGAGGARARLGSGIRGMVDRVEALGGELYVDSVPGRGTRVRAVIPCTS